MPTNPPPAASTPADPVVAANSAIAALYLAWQERYGEVVCSACAMSGAGPDDPPRLQGEVLTAGQHDAILGVVRSLAPEWQDEMSVLADAEACLGWALGALGRRRPQDRPRRRDLVQPMDRERLSPAHPRGTRRSRGRPGRRRHRRLGGRGGPRASFARGPAADRRLAAGLRRPLEPARARRIGAPPPPLGWALPTFGAAPAAPASTAPATSSAWCARWRVTDCPNIPATRRAAASGWPPPTRRPATFCTSATANAASPT